MESFDYFLPNIIKIDPCTFELYRFKVGAFFETQCSAEMSLAEMSRYQRLRLQRLLMIQNKTDTSPEIKRRRWFSWAEWPWGLCIWLTLKTVYCRIKGENARILMYKTYDTRNILFHYCALNMKCSFTCFKLQRSIRTPYMTQTSATVQGYYM